jgi:hypothetical protein
MFRGPTFWNMSAHEYTAAVSKCYLHQVVDACELAPNEEALPGQGTETVEPVLPLT